MFKVKPEDIANQKDALKTLSSTSSILFFDQFVKSLIPLYKKGEVPDIIRIAKDEDSLLAGDTEPLIEINLKDNIDLLDYQGLPMWHNQSSDQFSLHGLGLIEGNKAKPSQFTLYDTNPHGNIGGATGHGKSVLANDLLISASLVHPPWLVQYYLSDPKITEMKPYATSEFKLPHVDAVAATEDPEYAISMLRYLLEKMDKRANIYDKFRVKNIAAFNRESGLIMPMMVLVLDELKAMLQTAGRKAAVVDKLIQAFVAKARFAGGRCIMLSQGVVTELDPATMKNINIRMALGCVPQESEKLVGNPGASVNLGSMGKITYNDTPDKKLEDNVYFTSPFLPDGKNPHTNNIYDIFKHQHEVMEKLTYEGFRISPLSFFDQTANLTLDYFQASTEDLINRQHIFIGEPVYINKSSYEMAYINLEPNDEFSDNLGNNILFFSPNAKERLNFTATLLSNFEILQAIDNVAVNVYTPIKSTSETIKKLGYPLTSIQESTVVSDAFKRSVQQTMLRILIIKTDAEVFDQSIPDRQPTKVMEEILNKVNPMFGNNLTSLMKKRIITFLHLMDDPQVHSIMDTGGPLSEKNMQVFLDYSAHLPHYLTHFKCETSQFTKASAPLDIRIFYNFHLLNGAEIKTDRMMDQWMNIVTQAPEYGIHFIIITDMLPNCGTSLNSVFNKIVFFGVTMACVGQHKLADDYPDSTLEMMYVYADKTKVTNKCVKIKKVTALG